MIHSKEKYKFGLEVKGIIITIIIIITAIEIMIMMMM